MVAATRGVGVAIAVAVVFVVVHAVHAYGDGGTGSVVAFVACWVGIAQWVVEYVAVAVEALCVFGRLYNGVGLQEASGEWVVDSATHVDDVGVVNLLVSGESGLGDVE